MSPYLHRLPCLSDLSDCWLLACGGCKMNKSWERSECACVGGMHDPNNKIIGFSMQAMVGVGWGPAPLAVCGLSKWGRPDYLLDDVVAYSCAASLPGQSTTQAGCINFRYWMWRPNSCRNVTFVARCCCFLHCMVAHQLRKSSWSPSVLIELMLWSNQCSWCMVCESIIRMNQ